ncbi:hypothetical protein ACFX1R_039741 [Malus domestica]
MEDSAHSSPLPILLGRPLMKTAQTKIDVFTRTLTMEFDGDIINFQITDAMRYPSDDHSCFSIDIVDSLAQGHLEQLHGDALETAFLNGMESKNHTAASKQTHDHHEEDLACILVRRWSRWLLPLSHCHYNLH